MFEQAVSHHRAGRLADAEDGYRRILEQEPGYPDALHLLGVLAYQRGDHETAVRRITEAIQGNGRAGVFHSNLGNVFAALGRYGEAADAYQRAVRLSPGMADGHNNLGTALHQMGRKEEAAAAFGEAIRLQPSYPVAFVNRGRVLQELGRFAEAEECFLQACRIQPNHVESHRRLGMVRKELGLLEGAAESFSSALALDPRDMTSAFGLGVVLHDLKRYPESEENFRRVIAAQPGFAEGHFALGAAMKSQERLAEAEECLRRAVAIRPGYADAQLLLAAVLKFQGRNEEALAGYEETLRLRPDDHEALVAMGLMLKQEGRIKEAAERYRDAVRLRPERFETHLTLGLLLKESGQTREAIESLREAVRLNPESTGAHLGLGAALKDDKAFDEAAASIEQAIRLQPGMTEAHWLLGTTRIASGDFSRGWEAAQMAARLDRSDALRMKLNTLIPVIYESAEQVHETRARVERSVDELVREEAAFKDPAREIGTSNFYLAYQGFNDRELQQKIARLYASQAADFRPKGSPEGSRIRVGFISSNFKQHTIGKFTIGFVASLDRRRFEVVTLAVKPTDDAMTRQFSAQSDEYVAVKEDLAGAREQIAALNLDVLFYADIGMDAFTYFLAFSRLAPVQCVTWGHPVTTGIPNVDYFISSKDLEPEGAEDHYTEKLVRFDSLPAYYYQPRPANPFRPRGIFMIAERARVYLCPQSLFKIHPEFDGILGEILRRDPYSQLYFIDGLPQSLSDALMRRFRRTLAHGIGRVKFIPRVNGEAFLNVLSLANVILDPIHFGGGTTSYEAFSVGAPIVTLPGKFMRSRVTYACYKKMGVMDAVAATADEYVETAIRLADDRAFHQEMKAKILSANRVLYEDAAAVRELGAFFETAVAKARVQGA